MKRTVTSILAALTLLVGMVIAAAPSYAGTCTAYVVCGNVKNESWSTCTITVSDNWDPYYNRIAGNKRALYPGHSGSEFFKDTDGYYIPTGCHTAGGTYGPAHRKVNDLQYPHLTVYKN